MLSMIFAADENGAIGKDGDLPWRQSSDLQYFKQLTLDKTIVMGRKTWESLPGKLPRRRHLVMSRGTINEVEQTSVNEVLELAKNEDIFIIGGGEIYQLFLPYTNTVYRTVIHATVDNPDTFGPILSEVDFKLISESFLAKSEKDQFDMTFQQYERISN